MSQLADTVWREFAVEAEEHLHLIEPLLLRSHDQVSAGDIAQLFRSFHSLKGLGRTLGLTGIEVAAHFAENVLGIVRDGRRVLDAPLAEILLEAVDALKVMVHHASATRQDSPPPGGLLTRLKKAAGEADAEPQAPVEEPPPAASDDDDMLGFFAESLAENLPILSRALYAEPWPEGTRQAIVDAAEMVATGAEVMGFPLLHENMLELVARLPEDGAPEGDDHAAVVRLLDDLKAQAEIIAELTGADTGAAALANAIRPAGGEAGDPVAAVVSALTSADIAALTDAARAAWRPLSEAGCPRLGELCLLLVDIGQRAERGELAITPEILAACQPLATALGDGTIDIGLSDAEALAAGIRRAIEQAQDESAIGDGLRSIAGLPMRAEMADLLTPDQQAEITAALADGTSRLYCAQVFLEQSPEVAGAFIQWLQRSARAVTNRSVFEGLTTGFEFLILSPAEPDALKQQLLAVDPEGSCVRLVTALTEAGEVTVLSAETRTVEAPPRPEAAAGQQAPSHSVVRVRSELIDTLVNRIGEMLVVANGLGSAIGETAAGHLAALSAAVERLPEGDARALKEPLDGLAEAMRTLDGLHQSLDTAIQHLHEHTLDLRVVPLDSLFTRLARVVRDLASTQGKSVVFETHGADVRIDKLIVDQLAAPLTHMVRNAIDHGIEVPADRAAAGKPETARFVLRAGQRGNEALIEISDDGRGLNEQRILATAIERGIVTPAQAEELTPGDIHRLIFQPGFSTAEQVTETSGRGVGMDVVLTTVAGLGGRIDIITAPGRGTTFKILLPLSAALQATLLIGVGSEVMAIPDRHLSEIREMRADELTTVRGQQGVVLRGDFLPIFRLASLLGLAAEATESDTVPVVVLSNGQSRMGLVVDRLYRRQEMFMKDLNPRLATIPGIGGATILGDGRVVLVLDGEGLFSRARQQAARTVAGH